MLGKNRGKTRQSKHGKLARCDLAADHHQDFEEQVQKNGYIIHAKVGSDLSLVRFADDVEPSLIADCLKCKLKMVIPLQLRCLAICKANQGWSVIPSAKRIMFPLEKFINFEDKGGARLEPLANDAAYLHALITATQAYTEFLSGGKISRTSNLVAVHLARTAQILRERLSCQGEQLRLSETTMLVILMLCSFARMRGEYEAARQHMEGLRRVIQLKGGVGTLVHNPKLLIDAFRLVSQWLW